MPHPSFPENHRQRGVLRREHVLNPITALAFHEPGRPSAAVQAQANGMHSQEHNFRRPRYLFAAEDSNLKVYRCTDEVKTARNAQSLESLQPSTSEDRQFVGQITIFKAQSIHGISVRPSIEGDDEQDDLLLIWGGYSVALVSFKLLLRILDDPGMPSETKYWRIPVFTAPDWIFDAKISPSDDSKVVMLTAHNEVVETREVPSVATSFGKSLELVSVRSPSRPILYSGNMMWLDKDCVMVAAGTVFGEILVWKWHQGQEKQPQHVQCEHLFAFSGHEGSIFGIHISPEMSLPGRSGEKVRMLATCSDDRTVRVWDITERSGSDTEPRQLRKNIVEARETGFGDNSLTNPATPAGGETPNTELSQADEDSSRRCVAIAMGHVSRIWHVEFAEPRPEHPEVVPIYSFGEDTTAQKWHLTFDGTVGLAMEKTIPNGRLTNRTVFRNHTGKHLWAKSMMEVEHGNILIATGGSDGKITLVHDEDVACSSSQSTGRDSWQRVYSLEDLIRDFPMLPEPPGSALPTPAPETVEAESTETDIPAKPKKKAKTSKVPKESFQRYAFVSEDKLFVVSNRGRVLVGTFTNGLQWKQLDLPDDVRHSIAGYSIVQACTTTSTVYIGTSRGEIYAFSEKTGSTLQLVTTFEGKIADLICLEDTDKKDLMLSSRLLVTVLAASSATLLSVDESLTVQKSLNVSLEQGFVITAAGFVGQYLILGSRNGFISTLSWDEKSTAYTILLSFREESKDAITSIASIPQRSSSTSNHFLATCRDGKYRIYQVPVVPDSPIAISREAVILLQETTPPFGPLIERAWFVNNFTTNTTELMLCGFRSTHAVLWNATQQREVAIIECGGAHRSFALTLLQQSRKPDGFRFVYTKASQMHVFSQTKSQAQTIKPGSHGREIRAVSCSGRYIATGAEDTNIRIHEYICPKSTNSSRSEGQFRCVATIEKHATGIQTLRWYENQYLFSSGGNEEFFVWRVNRINSDVCPLGIVCEGVFKDKSDVGDLRIMDFDVEWLGGSQYDGGEKKERGTNKFCITMALSNSTIQSYLYSRETGFELLGRRRHTGACLMQLRHLGFSAKAGNSDTKALQPHVITASTDGHLAVFIGVDPTMGVEAAQREDTGDTVNLVPESGERLISRLHQSGFKSLDVLKVDDKNATDASASTTYLIVTGGDDNAIGMMHLTYSLEPTNVNVDNNLGGYSVVSKMILKSAHAAAVTGIGIVRLENSGRDAIIVSTGNDQRVKTWRLMNWQGHKSGDDTKLLLVADEYSGVADSGDLEVMDTASDDDEEVIRFLVGGVGMEVWEV